MTPNRRNVAEAALAGLTTEQERRNEALIHQCEMLIAAIRAVVDNWGHGDLAAAVNNARECAESAENWINHGCGVE